MWAEAWKKVLKITGYRGIFMFHLQFPFELILSVPRGTQQNTETDLETLRDEHIVYWLVHNWEHDWSRPKLVHVELLTAIFRPDGQVPWELPQEEKDKNGVKVLRIH